MANGRTGIDELVSQLRHGETQADRMEAAIGLGAIGSQEAILALTHALADEDLRNTTRHFGKLCDVITDQLVAIGEPAVPALTALLEDKFAAWYAKEALRFIREHPDGVKRTPKVWPLVLYGMLAAFAVAVFVGARSASSLERALKTGSILDEGAAQLIEAVCIGLVVGAVVGMIIQGIRLAKSMSSSEPQVVRIEGVESYGVPHSPESSGTDAGRALRDLEALHADGLVTDDEYAAKRAEILSRL